ncbi:MAG: PRC-barrel domain-containing protein, partial [Acidobacteriota bacterium]
LEGCLVETLDGGSVGYVREVTRPGGGIEMLAVENEEGKRHLVPMVQAIVLGIDIERKRIRIDPPDGLLEL